MDHRSESEDLRDPLESDKQVEYRSLIKLALVKQFEVHSKCTQSDLYLEMHFEDLYPEILSAIFRHLEIAWK